MVYVVSGKMIHILYSVVAFEISTDLRSFIQNRTFSTEQLLRVEKYK